MKKIMIEFQDGKIIPALWTEAEEISFRRVRPWRKVMVDLNPEHIDKLSFPKFVDLKFWDRFRLLFWKDKQK